MNSNIIQKKIFFIIITLFITNIHAQLGNIPDTDSWKQKMNEKYSAAHPDLDATNDDDTFGWSSHYWMRAYGRMARLTGDVQWVDWGFELMDHMFANTDRERWKRGELTDTVYDSKGLTQWQKYWCLSNPTQGDCPMIPAGPDSSYMSIAWRQPPGGQPNWSVDVLNVGMIVHGMMRFIDAVLSDSRFASYHTKAHQAIQKISDIVDLFDQNYSYDFYPTDGGGYFATRDNNPFADWGDPANDRLYSGGLPLNHSTTMSVALVLLDKWDGPRPEYRRMADSTMAHWLRHVSEQNGAFTWYYRPRVPDDRMEDVIHGHVDLSLPIVLYEVGSPMVNDSIMTLFAKVVNNNMNLGNGDVSLNIDGSGGKADGTSAFHVSLDYLNFAPWDSSLVETAKEVLIKNAGSVWSRSMLGWANVLYWENKFAEKNDSIPTHLIQKTQSNLHVHLQINMEQGNIQIRAKNGKLYTLKGEGIPSLHH